MFSPQKAVLRIGEVTAAGLVKRVRVDSRGRIVPPDQGKGMPVWKLSLAVFVFLALLVVVTVLAN
jgi:hypothetical protein